MNANEDMEPPELSCTTGGDAKRIVQPTQHTQQSHS